MKKTFCRYTKISNFQKNLPNPKKKWFQTLKSGKKQVSNKNLEK